MSISRNTPHSRRISTPQSNHILPLLSYDHLWPPAPLRDVLWASRARRYIVTLCGYQKLSEASQDVPEHVRDLPHDFIRIQTSCRFFPNIGLYGLRVSLTFFMFLTYVSSLCKCHYILYLISKWANSQNRQSPPIASNAHRKRQNKPSLPGKPKPRKGQDDQKTVDRFGRANHKGFQAQILLLLLEHDLDFPTMRIMLQHLLIGKA